MYSAVCLAGLFPNFSFKEFVVIAINKLKAAFRVFKFFAFGGGWLESLITGISNKQLFKII
jgi:hypothetical protein